MPGYRHNHSDIFMPAPALTTVFLLDRDHSIFAFDERVLDWAQRTHLPHWKPFTAGRAAARGSPARQGMVVVELKGVRTWI
jgi:hypothetical protein